MLHKKIDIPKENFYQIMTKLGSISSSIEFEDLNKNEIESSKTHYSMINRCDEIETLFNHLDEIFNHFGINYELYDNYDKFQKHLDFEIKRRGEKTKESNFFDIIQNEIIEDENKIKTQYSLNKQQIDSFHKLLEKKYVYEKMVEIFENNVIDDKNGKLNIDYIELNDENEELNLINRKSSDFRKSSESLKYLSGMCGIEDVMKLRRIIFRAGKGLAIPFFYSSTFNSFINIIIIKEIFFKLMRGILFSMKKNISKINKYF